METGSGTFKANAITTMLCVQPYNLDDSNFVVNLQAITRSQSNTGLQSPSSLIRGLILVHINVTEPLFNLLSQVLVISDIHHQQKSAADSIFSSWLTQVLFLKIKYFYFKYF